MPVNQTTKLAAAFNANAVNLAMANESESRIQHSSVVSIPEAGATPILKIMGIGSKEWDGAAVREGVRDPPAFSDRRMVSPNVRCCESRAPPVAKEHRTLWLRGAVLS